MIVPDKTVAFLRCFVPMGHTSGRDSTTFTIHSVPDSIRHLPYDEVQEMMKELGIAKSLGTLSACQRNMAKLLYGCGILEALVALEEHENDNNP